jgi:hypothetical protein
MVAGPIECSFFRLKNCTRNAFPVLSFLFCSCFGFSGDLVVLTFGKAGVTAHKINVYKAQNNV